MAVVHLLVKSAYMVYDKGCQLVAGKTRDGPCGKGDAVDRADILHTIMIGQQSGYVAESAAVTCVYHKQQDQNQDHQYGGLSHVRDALGHNDKSGCNDGKDNHDLVDRISVFHGVSPCGETQASAGVEDSRHGRQDARHACKADTLDDHFLLGDQGKSTGDIARCR